VPIRASTARHQTRPSSRRVWGRAMPLTAEELNQLASNVELSHDGGAVALACLVHLARSRLKANGSPQSAGLRQLHLLGMACVRHYAQQVGIPWSDVRSAMDALQRAGDTAGYLHRLPD